MDLGTLGHLVSVVIECLMPGPLPLSRPSVPVQSLRGLVPSRFLFPLFVPMLNTSFSVLLSQGLLAGLLALASLLSQSACSLCHRKLWYLVEVLGLPPEDRRVRGLGRTALGCAFSPGGCAAGQGPS